MLAGGLIPLLSHTGTTIPVFGQICCDMVAIWLHVMTLLIFTEAKGGLHAQGEFLCPWPMIYIQFGVFFSEFIRFKLQPNSFVLIGHIITTAGII